ncbi:hypothetical protein DFH06DRAFT_1330189 [Mycena polygramma]|nr:hypothetical protein DFH06DRAFT_1330189 [Mycena polygramma]
MPVSFTVASHPAKPFAGMATARGLTPTQLLAEACPPQYESFGGESSDYTAPIQLEDRANERMCGVSSILTFPEWATNVVDTARRLHVAALIDPACNGKRIFAVSENPARLFIEDGPDLGQNLTELPTQESEALLRKHFQKGFTSLEETIKENNRNVL